MSGSGAPPPITSTTLGDLFEEIGTREPDALAYVDGDQRLTYGEWLAGADSLAAELRARGVAPGDVVAFWLSSCIDYAVAYAACTRLGAVATGINTRLGPGEVTAILAPLRAGRRCSTRATTSAVPGDAPTPKVLMPRAEVRRGVAGGHAAHRPARSRPRATRCASCGRAAPPACRRARGSTTARWRRRPGSATSSARTTTCA